MKRKSFIFMTACTKFHLLQKRVTEIPHLACTRSAFKSYKVSTRKGKNRKRHGVLSQRLFFVKQGAGHSPSRTPVSPHRTPPPPRHPEAGTAHRQTDGERAERNRVTPTVSGHRLALRLPRAKELPLPALRGVKTTNHIGTLSRAWRPFAKGQAPGSPLRGRIRLVTLSNSASRHPVLLGRRTARGFQKGKRFRSLHGSLSSCR